MTSGNRVRLGMIMETVMMRMMLLIMTTMMMVMVIPMTFVSKIVMKTKC